MSMDRIEQALGAESRLREIADRDEAKAVTVRADDLRAALSALATLRAEVGAAKRLRSAAGIAADALENCDNGYDRLKGHELRDALNRFDRAQEVPREGE